MEVPGKGNGGPLQSRLSKLRALAKGVVKILQISFRTETSTYGTLASSGLQRDSSDSLLVTSSCAELEPTLGSQASLQAVVYDDESDPTVIEVLRVFCTGEVIYKVISSLKSDQVPLGTKRGWFYFPLKCGDWYNYITMRLLRRKFLVRIYHVAHNQQHRLVFMELLDIQSEFSVTFNILSVFASEIRKEPKLPETLRTAKCCLSSPARSGNVYLQMEPKYVHVISQLLHLAANNIIRMSTPLPAVTDIEEEVVYAYVNFTTDEYYRIKVIGQDEEEEEGKEKRVLVLYIDYGIQVSVSMSNIYNLERICPTLTFVPSQAIQVKVVNVNDKWRSLKSTLSHLIKPDSIVKVTKLKDGIKKGNDNYALKHSPIAYVSITTDTDSDNSSEGSYA